MHLPQFTGKQRLRDLTMATWDVGLGQVKRAVPAAFEPLAVDGRGLVSIVGFCARNVKVGALPGPPYSGVNLRTYVRDREGVPAIFILQSRVTPLGMGALLLGLPVRATMIAARPGSLVARGMGVSFRYEISSEATALPPLDPPIGALELAYWKAAGIRRLRTAHAPIEWRGATATEASTLDPVLAHGFDAKQPPWLHYAKQAEFELMLPPRRIARR